jgi:hypothetical protein
MRMPRCEFPLRIMLSRAQQILLKRAQRECGLPDREYRDALELVCHCRTSKDPVLTDRHLDKVLSYFEAIHWRGVDAGELQPPSKPDAVFRQRGYWASKNTRQETSRDRFAGRNLSREIGDLERKLHALGFSDNYCDGIRSNVTHGRDDAHALHLYRAALERTLRAKVKHEQPQLL